MGQLFKAMVGVSGIIEIRFVGISVVMGYREPRQWRSQQTEKAFLDAFDRLLLTVSYHEATIAGIADEAGLTQGAFMSRFGSKQVALERLFDRFCQAVYQALTEIDEGPWRRVELTTLLEHLSKTYEALVTQHWGANRAMHELFLKTGSVSPQTKQIFKATTVMLYQQLEARAMAHLSPEAVFAAAQLLVTINYNYVLKAMPALPEDSEARHALIAKLMAAALT